MITCQHCNSNMKQLFSSLYCPNDCDKKESPSSSCDKSIGPGYVFYSFAFAEAYTSFRQKNSIGIALSPDGVKKCCKMKLLSGSAEITAQQKPDVMGCTHRLKFTSESELELLEYY